MTITYTIIGMFRDSGKYFYLRGKFDQCLGNFILLKNTADGFSSQLLPMVFDALISNRSSVR